MLEILPQKILELEQELKNIETLLADSNLYTNDVDKFNQLSVRHQTITQEIEINEDQWLEIQMIKDSFTN